MDSKQIQEQIETIEKVTEQATRSEQSARHFLFEAGIGLLVSYKSGQPCHGDKCWAHKFTPCETCGRISCEGEVTLNK